MPGMTGAMEEEVVPTEAVGVKDVEPTVAMVVEPMEAMLVVAARDMVPVVVMEDRTPLPVTGIDDFEPMLLWWRLGPLQLYLSKLRGIATTHRDCAS